MAQTSFTVTLRHSRLWNVLLWSAHLGLGVGFMLTPWPITWRVVGLLLVFLSGFSIWQRQRNTPTLELRVATDKQEVWLRLYAAAEWQRAHRQGHHWVSPWLTVFTLRTEAGQSYPLVVLPDSCPAEAFRQLRVWLRWSRGV